MCMYMSEDERILLEFAWDSVNHAVRHLIPEDSKMGYFQLLILNCIIIILLYGGMQTIAIVFLFTRKNKLNFLIERNRREVFSIWFDEKYCLF